MSHVESRYASRSAANVLAGPSFETEKTLLRSAQKSFTVGIDSIGLLASMSSRAVSVRNIARILPEKSAIAVVLTDAYPLWTHRSGKPQTAQACILSEYPRTVFASFRSSGYHLDIFPMYPGVSGCL